MSDRLFITKKQAIGLLPKGKQVHTFVNPNGMLIGADWSKKELIEKINNSKDNDLEIGGETCKGLKHALIMHSDNRVLFVETDMEKVKLIDK